MSRRRKPPPTLREMEAADAADRARQDREDTFFHGPPDDILSQWWHGEPSDEELRVIIKNILARMREAGL